MQFHGSYFSNYSSWLILPYTILPTSHIIWDLVNQISILLDLNSFKQGLYATLG